MDLELLHEELGVWGVLNQNVETNITLMILKYANLKVFTKTYSLRTHHEQNEPHKLSVAGGIQLSSEHPGLIPKSLSIFQVFLVRFGVNFIKKTLQSTTQKE